MSTVTVTSEPVAGTYIVNYDVSGSPIAVDSIIAVNETGAYTQTGIYNGGSLVFSTTNAIGSDALDIARSGTVSSVAGTLSVSSTGLVYLGNGTGSTQIGTISGAGTANLQISFSSTLVTDAAVQGLARMVLNLFADYVSMLWVLRGRPT